MLTIKSFIVNSIEENCYVVSDETKEAVIIDCGTQTKEEFQVIDDYIRSQQLRPAHLLNTHGHFDHIWGDGFVYDAYGLKPEIHPDDLFLYENVTDQFLTILHRAIPITLPSVGKLFEPDDVISWGTHQFKVIASPGHTPGGVCFLCEEESVLFTGDTIFRHAIGRTDLPYGNTDAMQSSLIRHILTLPKTIRIFPGHGEPSTIGEEQRFHGVEFLS